MHRQKTHHGKRESEKTQSVPLYDLSDNHSLVIMSPSKVPGDVTVDTRLQTPYDGSQTHHHDCVRPTKHGPGLGGDNRAKCKWSIDWQTWQMWSLCHVPSRSVTLPTHSEHSSTFRQVTWFYHSGMNQLFFNKSTTHGTVALTTSYLITDHKTNMSASDPTLLT